MREFLRIWLVAVVGGVCGAYLGHVFRPSWIPRVERWWRQKTTPRLIYRDVEHTERKTQCLDRVVLACGHSFVTVTNTRKSFPCDQCRDEIIQGKQK